MFYNSKKSFIITISVLIVSLACNISARVNKEDEDVTMKTRKLNGPRLGITYVAQSDLLGRNGALEESLKNHDIGAVISQFGWHFEWLVAPESGGPSFVTQLIPLIGGVEYATVIPSLSLVLGLRMPNGFELGMGPSILLKISEMRSNRQSSPVNTSLIVAVGKSIDFSGVSIPLNLAVATNQGGTRFSFMFGYAIKSNS
jgi:hypothetical protein